MTEKTVLITGSSSGIGRETAELFHDEGWRVYATARDTDDVAALDELGCATAELDVTDDAAVEAVVDRVVSEAGHLDCVVNNAGYGRFGPMEDVPVADLHAQFDVNVYGPHRLARAVLPHMRERGDGTIVNISSVAGRVATPGMGAYSGSKFAIEGISDAMRPELDPHGVDVVLVEPGPVETNFDERATEELGRTAKTDAYETLYRFYEDREVFGGASPVAVEPGAVAATIYEAACSPNPKARYPVGTFGKLSLRTRFLPDSVRDTFFRLVRKVL